MPLGETLFIGVHLVGLLVGVHVEVAVAGLGSGGAAVSAAAKEAGAEREGGERGDLGKRGFVGEGLRVKSKVKLLRTGIFENKRD